MIYFEIKVDTWIRNYLNFLLVCIFQLIAQLEMKHAVPISATEIRIKPKLSRKILELQFLYASFFMIDSRNSFIRRCHSPFVPKLNGERWWRSFAYCPGGIALRDLLQRPMASASSPAGTRNTLD